MPIYEYQCTGCNHQFDLIQKMSDPAVTECPDCHKNTAVRLVSAAGFQLKGSGWYVTDFKNKASGDSKTTEKKADSSGAGEKSRSETSTTSKGESS